MFMMGSAYQDFFISDDWIDNYENFKECPQTKIEQNWYSKTKPLMYVRYGLQIIIYMIFTNIIIVSIMEWSSMYYIIKSQEGRSIGEIMFDHHQENMDSIISQRDSNDSRYLNQ